MNIASELDFDDVLKNADVWRYVIDQHAIVSMANARGDILYVNDKFCAITGYSAGELLGQNHRIINSGTHSQNFFREMWRTIADGLTWHGEICNKAKNGNFYWVKSTIIPIMDSSDKIAAYISIRTDISEQKNAAEQIEYLAYHDQLTGLPNRRLLKDRLIQAICSADRYDERLVVIYLDLDHFNDVNDHLGHAAGDDLLKIVAERLQGCIRGDDTLARMGGDEFVLLLNGMSSTDDMTSFAGKIRDALSQPITIGSNELSITCSLGVSMYPQDGRDADDLLKYADAALYHAKQQGRATYCFYTQALHDQLRERVQMEKLLRHALKHNEFELHYQPQVDMSNGAIVGCEALIRWNHTDMGQIPPGRFIPIAEQSELIIGIGHWVMHEACRQAKCWLDQGWNIKVSFNVSARQFMRPAELMESLHHALAESGVDATCMGIELTESLLLDPQGMSLVLNEIKALGILLALDDFGTGYSSLSYLRRFPISVLKIDQSFVSNADRSLNDAEMVLTIIGMAHNLGLGLVAEGIETKSQHDLLVAQGCEVGQGYYYSRPVPADEFTHLLQRGILKTGYVEAAANDSGSLPQIACPSGQRAGNCKPKAALLINACTVPTRPAQTVGEITCSVRARGPFSRSLK